MSVFVEIFNDTFGGDFKDPNDKQFVKKCFDTWLRYGKTISFEDVISTILADAVWKKLEKPSHDDKYCWFGESIECFLNKANIEAKDGDFKGEGDNPRYIKPDLSFISGQERVIVEIKSPSRNNFLYPKKDIIRLAKIKAAHSNISTYVVIMNDSITETPKEWVKHLERLFNNEIGSPLTNGQKVRFIPPSILIIDEAKKRLSLHLFEIG